MTHIVGKITSINLSIAMVYAPFIPVLILTIYISILEWNRPLIMNVAYLLYTSQQVIINLVERKYHDTIVRTYERPGISRVKCRSILKMPLPFLATTQRKVGPCLPSDFRMLSLG